MVYHLAPAVRQLLLFLSFSFLLGAQTRLIKWSLPNIEQVMYAGQSDTLNVSFSSSQDLGPVSVFVVPDLAGFVSVEPAGFSGISRGMMYSITARILVPPSTPLGTVVDGTIQIKSAVGDRGTIPATLKVVLKVNPVTVAYTVTDLGTLGGSDSGAAGINNLGKVAGGSSIASGRFHAFRTAPNSPINPATDDLGTLGGCFSSAAAINSSGQVVGYSTTECLGGNFGAFRTAPNSPINPATDIVGADFATGINDSGQVVGYSVFAFPNFAFRTAPNSHMNRATDDLGSLGGSSSSSSANAINNLGQVVGASCAASCGTGGAQFHAFRTAPNSSINPATDDLGTLGGLYSSASGINNLGQVVGVSTTASGQSHAFRTAANSPINPATDDLGTLGGSGSQANGINSSGQVVGYSTTVSGQSHAFLYSGGLMYDLNNLIPPRSGWALGSANGINDLGQIVGSGSHNGQTRAFLLTPVK